MEIRKYLPIYLSVVLWHIGGSLVIPFTSIWLRSELGESSFMYLAMFISLPNIIAIVGITIISQFTDKHGHYRLSILLINIIGTIEYILLSSITHASEYLLIMGVGALIFPSYYTITQAFATNICEPTEKGSMTSYLMLSASTGWFFGASASGILFDLFGMHTLLLLAAVMFLSSGIAITFAPAFTPQQPVENKLKSTYWQIMKNRQIALIILSMVIIDFSAGAFFVMGSVYFYERLSMPTELIGYTNALATLLGTIYLIKYGSLPDKIGRRPIFIIGLILYPALFVSISLFPNIYVVFILWGLPIFVLLRPVIPAMISDLTNEYERSRGMALVTISSTVAMTLGAISIGYITDITGNINIWPLIPAIAGWFAVFIGYTYVRETLIL